VIAGKNNENIGMMSEMLSTSRHGKNKFLFAAEGRVSLPAGIVTFPHNPSDVRGCIILTPGE